MTNKERVFKDLAVMFSSKHWQDKHPTAPYTYDKEDIESVICVLYVSLSPNIDSTFNGTTIDEFLTRYIK